MVAAFGLPGFQPQAQASQDSSESELDGWTRHQQTTTVLTKVSSIVAHIWNSTTATDLLEDQPVPVCQCYTLQ
ncbi:hypothetical protein EOD39_8803 [Acipenser ruthenus]|uniref:Uncharacterized protein n=1 Tax=Acipenser ruthenus TaxID=7906 RepID=A0A444U2L6_ACIRT|nr:hypothetical protein EOD39_8803 [Acipenser ruthenus]